jgi:hypothetical protein
MHRGSKRESYDFTAVAAFAYESTELRGRLAQRASHERMALKLGHVRSATLEIGNQGAFTLNSPQREFCEDRVKAFGIFGAAQTEMRLLARSTS